ncbi:TrmH family RNA methyltransferase [Thalassolituus marinus]|uniref:RNA methyltransferase n=1 Tax=Thalassolituus marinus TaxID=671053 RepID=A0ABS7ZSX8_9GAMM|nr:RNA methyltransferase [Thalassolituus marinus]MCA6064867.1 RNA methyltransferase [Thalassolituus marinus]
MKADDVKKLQQKKYRSEFRHYLVEGEHLVLELQKAAATQPHLQRSELFITEEYSDWVAHNLTLDIRVTVVGKKSMAQMSDTKSPQGIIAVVPFAPAAETSAADSDKAVYLHEVQDPGNLGTILRTLGWFGGFRCLLSAGSVDPYNPKVVRSSMGAIFHTPIEQDVDISALPQRFGSIACLDMQGEPLSSISDSKHRCFVFGNEARGVPREQLAALNAQAYTIPGSGTIESLNLASAVNMCVYELMR